jgi:5-methylcytosine-specific restriction enzyme A
VESSKSYPWIKKQRNRSQLEKEREGYYKDRERFQRWYQSANWQRLRLIVLAENPFCVGCKVEIATEVDHIVPLSENISLANDIDNLQSLCSSCHKKKTVADTKRKNDIERDEEINSSMNEMNEF